MFINLFSFQSQLYSQETMEHRFLIANTFLLSQTKTRNKEWKYYFINFFYIFMKNRDNLLFAEILINQKN